MKQYFKILDENGRSCHGGNFQWSLPTQDSDGNWIPGEWHEHNGDVVLGKSGFQLTDDPYHWLKNKSAVYECEISDDAIVSEYDNVDYKIAVSKVRLTKLFTGIVRNTRNIKEQHYVNGKLHRDNDMPAVINSSGSQHWYQNGLKHRYNDMPADVFVNGDQCWFKDGLCHRDNDMPALIFIDGEQFWYRNGLQHRDNDMPAMIRPNGDQYWFQNGKLHRDNDMPVVIYNDGKTRISD